MMSFCLLLPVTLIMEGVRFTPGAVQALGVVEPAKLFQRASGAAFTFHMYQQVSYMILSRVSPVTHSIGNCVKRCAHLPPSFFAQRVRLQCFAQCTLRPLWRHRARTIERPARACTRNFKPVHALSERPSERAAIQSVMTSARVVVQGGCHLRICPVLWQPDVQSIEDQHRRGACRRVCVLAGQAHTLWRRKAQGSMSLALGVCMCGCEQANWPCTRCWRCLGRACVCKCVCAACKRRYYDGLLRYTS